MDNNIYSIRRDKTYSIKIFSPIGYDEGTQIEIPETHMGVPVTEMVFANKINSDFKSIHISANINNIIFPQGNFIYDVRIFAQEITVDERNSCYRVIDNALYSKDGKILYFVFEYHTENYTVPDGTEIIERGALSYLRGLRSVRLPEGLKAIGAECFAYCPVLERIEFPGSLEAIGEYAFCYCAKISFLDIPDNVRAVGKGAFFGMETLCGIHLPKRLNKLEDDLFERCRDLRSLVIPANVSHIADKAFGINIEEITAHPDNHAFSSENGTLFNKDKTKLLRASLKLKKYLVPDTVKAIQKRAFAHNSSIEEVVLPEGCASIQASAFYESSLKKINLGSVSEIGQKAFYNCGKLNDIELNCNTVSAAAFYGCENLKKAVLGENVHTIKEAAFFRCPIEELVIPKQTRSLEESSLDFRGTLVIYDSVPFSENAVSCGDTKAYPKMNIIIKSAETGKVLHNIWMGYELGIFRRKVLECFDKKWDFDYDKFDDLFRMISITGVSVFGYFNCEKYTDLIYAAAGRLENSPSVPEKKREYYLKWFRITGLNIIKDCIDRENFELLEFSEKYGTVNADNITEAIEYSSEKRAVEFTAHLLSYRDKYLGDLPDNLNIE